jgi:hypothetical protein
VLTILKKAATRIRYGIANASFLIKNNESARDVFLRIYRDNVWGSLDSRSGEGSDLVQTEAVRRELPLMIKELSLKSMLDIPCGDLYWMKEMIINIDYIGADVVPEIIDRNHELYANGRRSFVVLDITKDELPTVDLIFSRDLLVHLSFMDIFSALRTVKHSGAIYLLTTTFCERDSNIDIQTGKWRPLNLQKSPFNFPEPERIINENCTEGSGIWSDKCLGLWRISELP